MNWEFISYELLQNNIALEIFSSLLAPKDLG